LLDGTPLHAAVTTIDAAAAPKPLAYLINCTHASFAREALQHPANSSPFVRQRVIGLLANTAALSPEELDGSSNLVEEDPAAFSAALAALSREIGLKILGGCCGTDDRHIRALAARLAADPQQPS
jgi:homocysteine S-methyltransferase